MKTVLIVGHPDLRSSRINAALLEESKSIQDVHIRVLSELYGTGSIDIQAEQEAIAGAAHIVLQYPTYWYAMPSILKRWLDEVLTRGWAYGTGTPGRRRHSAPSKWLSSAAHGSGRGAPVCGKTTPLRTSQFLGCGWDGA